MVMTFRVTLPGLKGFLRVYRMKPSTTLYEFHKKMRDDMEFPHDQLIQFKALDADGNLVARYGMFDLGSGTVDEVTVAQTVEKGVASFTYFYNVAERKSVIVTFDGCDEEAKDPSEIELTEQKGPIPEAFENGYVAYEDLPPEQRHLPGENPLGFLDDDDEEGFDDEDDDDEDDDDDDEEIIYDEKEGM